MQTYDFREGSTPLLVSMPHVGTHVPDAIAAQLTDEALTVPDTDWHVDRLYDFAAGLCARLLRARLSRYVIDLNRPPDGAELYAGARNTELCPTTTFHDEPLYRSGHCPDEAEVSRRRERYWQPYHERLRAALAALRERHGIALLFDAHSIASRVPRFFEGRLPDLNLGTAGGTSCDARLEQRLADVVRGAAPFTAAVNGRFKGGYITRSRGDPANGVHAVQLELSQATYMQEEWPFTFREDLADRVRPHLRALLETMLAWAAERQRYQRARETGVAWIDFVGWRMLSGTRFFLGNLAGADEAFLIDLGQPLT